MPENLDKAAEVVGDAVGTIETAAVVAGSKVRQGLSEAAATIGNSKTADLVEKRARPIRKAAAKKAKSIKKTIKKQAAVAKRKATIAKMFGIATVDGSVVAEAEMMCKLADRTIG